MTAVYWIRHQDHTDMFSQGYIGVSKNADQRYVQHKNRTQNAYLKHAINKYGWDNLVKQVVIVAEESYCLDVEFKLRPNDQMGWNLVKGGGMPPSLLGKKYTRTKPAWNKGLEFSSDTKLKISANVKKLWEDSAYRQHMIDAHAGHQGPMVGKKHTDEAKSKISKANKGRSSRFKGIKVSPERLEQIKIGSSAYKWICPHCDTSGANRGAANRWHFDNCKNKGEV